MKSLSGVASSAYAPGTSQNGPSLVDEAPVSPFRQTSRTLEDADPAKPVRITHFSHNDQRGGGPLASFRLHRELKAKGADSRMLVMKKHHDDPAIKTILSPSLSGLIEVPARILDRSPLRLYPKRARDVIWSPGWFSLPNFAAREIVRDADVLSLYWINGGFLSISEVTSLLELEKPVVWRLSDLWAFTGGCHHAAGCEGYRHACGQCPQLGSRSGNDLSARLLRAKTRWPTERLVVVTPSHWLGDLARSSAVFRDCRIERITTGIDIDLFSPWPCAQARRHLGLPQDRTLILFGANHGVRNPKKGFSHLIEALEQLTDLGKADHVDLVVFGQTAPLPLPLSCPVHMMGAIHDETAMATLFSAVDVFATPSLEENLPNTVIEAMACGTPAVAFDVGGTGELIEHKRNGYLARPGDSSDFCRGLAHLIRSQQADGQRLSRAARDFIVDHHDIRNIASRYLDLYRELHTTQHQKRAA